MKFSIVMPSLNQRRFLEAAIRSVLDQEGNEHGAFGLELHVVDGGSTDGSVDLLRSIADPRLSWTSEPDRGQADAVNRGLARAGGDVIGWLNADDLYAPGAIAAVAAAFERSPQTQWLAGRCEIIDEEGCVIRQAVTRYKDRQLRRYRLGALKRENFISQMSVFWRRPFGADVGPLDASLFYTMDYDLWVRMAARCDPLVLDRILARFRLHRGSKSGAVNRRQFDEQYEVARRHFPGDRLDLLAHRLNVEKTVWAYRLMRLLERSRRAA